MIFSSSDTLFAHLAMAKQLIEDFDSLAEEHLKIKAQRDERNRLALERQRYRRNDGDSDVEDR